MNSSALHSVLVVDQNGEYVAFYDDIDVGITLENFRQILIQKLAYATPTFDFTFRSVPISSTQEQFLTLQQVACKLESKKNGFKVTLKLRKKDTTVLLRTVVHLKNNNVYRMIHRPRSQQHQVKKQLQGQRQQCEFLVIVK